ncbi:MAG: zinc-binding dehydrogenase [Gemmatimonadetes bacterium]|nr:zinc-binding dehydrogenase [Gemmatimonadota bacterium]
MKAAYFHEHGGPEVIEYGDRPDPEPGPTDVLIEVRAAGLNHLDLWVRRGLPGLELEMPHIGGSDVSGVVAASGSDVTGWSVGDRVAVNPGLSCGSCEWCEAGEEPLCPSYRILGEHVAGGFAELAVAPAANLVAIPDAISFETAAVAPLVYQTAWRGLVSRGGLAAGHTALITGASGGVSTAAIQIAKHLGARVIAVTSGTRNAARVEELGADIVIDRLALDEDLSKVVWRETAKRGVDVALDSVGEAMWDSTFRTLARGGRMVVYGATTGPKGAVDIRRMFWLQTSIVGTTMASRAEFERVMALVLDGTLKPVIDDAWSMSRARDAHERLETGGVFGKLVLTPDA